MQICSNNPSVSLAADSSLYTREPLNLAPEVRQKWETTSPPSASPSQLPCEGRT